MRNVVKLLLRPVSVLSLGLSTMGMIVRGGVGNADREHPVLFLIANDQHAQCHNHRRKASRAGSEAFRPDGSTSLADRPAESSGQLF
jgi:hypothetical protein